MRSSKFVGAMVVAGFLVGAITAQANLILNGSFETPDLGTGWGLYQSIPGWTAAAGSPLIEIGGANNYGVSGQDKDQVMELDSTGNVTVYQLQNLSAGIYDLSFLYAKRGGRDAADCMFEVYWNSTLLNSFTPLSTVMTRQAFTVAANSGFNTLGLKGTGTQTSYGAIVDDFQLVQVPDGGMTLALLGFAVTGLAVFRRRK